MMNTTTTTADDDETTTSNSTGIAMNGSSRTNKKPLLNLNNMLMQLRKLCNHPYLVLEDIQTIPDDLYYQYLIASSGKLFVLDKILHKLLAAGSKVSYCNKILGYIKRFHLLCNIIKLFNCVI